MVTMGVFPFQGKRAHGRAGNRTRDLMVSTQELLPLSHEAGRIPNKLNSTFLYAFHFSTQICWPLKKSHFEPSVYQTNCFLTTTYIFAQLYRRSKNLLSARANWIYSHYHSTLYKWTVIEDNVSTSASCLTRTHQTHKFTYWCCHSKQCICLIIEQTARWIPCFPLANYSAPNTRCTYHVMYQNHCCRWKRISSLSHLWDSDKRKTLYFITCTV